MRAAGAVPRPFALTGRHGHTPAGDAAAGYAPARRQEKVEWRPGVGLGILFLLGYFGGIVAAKLAGSDFGAVLAQYYLDAAQYEQFTHVWASWFAGAFLQLSAVLLCGFSAVGGPLLAFGFACKGWVLGLCAASVYAAAARRGLVIYWLLTCLPDLALLWLMLCFALYAWQASGALARFAFGSQGRARLQPNIKSMIIRYFISVLLSLAFSAVGAASAVLFAGVLL